MNQLSVKITLCYYLLASVLTFFVYMFDKRAARKGYRRVPEQLLHLCGLFGGWPGGLLGQQLLRHKTRKVPFLVNFWGSAALNCCVLGWMAGLWA